MDDLGFLLLFIMAFTIFALIVGVIVCGASSIIDSIYGYELEDVTIECVITHMDIDDGYNLISVVSIDNNFSKTMRVSSEEYAKYIVGDSCTVVKSGYHSPLNGDIFQYKIAE